ncbi:alpha/beta hydrolase-fold protein [Flagellimonas profundi]|uniref:Tetratricopeptide repeat protein n=1 Tax=Flagellimonas profundi TaxID=2915620 RepID=A0ABS3FB85_9FLAO|nr:alpha/beta hydrolase-fold protein [Allomuricauda profundi]MBO0340409.1 tetratricopeptide repeat protein [Allomuricauda profundi]
MGKIVTLILVWVLFASNKVFAQNTMEQFEVVSQYLQENRMAHVALPKQYGQSTKEYPLILILDHELLFNTTSAIVNQLSGNSRMPEAIVASLSAGSQHRNYYAPNLYNNHRDRSYNYGNHQDELLSFIEKELLPHLEKKYRLAKFRMIVGFSPASVFAFHTVLNKPDLFQAYICLAAGNIIGDGHAKDQRLIEAFEELYRKPGLPKHYLYVVSGGKDVEDQPYIQTNVKDFNDLLKKYQASGIYAKAEIIEGEGHTDVVLPGLISAFNFIFPRDRWDVDYLNLIEQKGTAKANILHFYDELSKTYNFKIYPNADRLYSMSCLKNIGRRLLGANKTEEAIELYQYWTDLYPRSHLAHYFLGMSYKEANNLEKAAEAYNRSHTLALSQNSDDAKLYKKALETITN